MKRGKKGILTEEQVRAIRKDHRPSQAIADELGLSRSYIQLIKQGLRYKWVR